MLVLPSTDAQFPRWIATDRHWSRYFVNLGSPGSALMRRPSSFSRTSDFEPTGEKIWPGGRSRYYSLFLSSATAVTFPGSWVAYALYESKSVRGVASQTNEQPDFHGATDSIWFDFCFISANYAEFWSQGLTNTKSGGVCPAIPSTHSTPAPPIHFVCIL